MSMSMILKIFEKKVSHKDQMKKPEKILKLENEKY